MNSKTVNPDIECEFLYNTGKLNIALGSLLSILTVKEFVNVSEHAFINVGFIYLIAIVALCMLGYYLFKSLRFRPIFFSKNSLTSTFEDEFLNSVNLIAYKAAFILVMIVLFCGIYGGSYVEQISGSEISSCVFALGSLVYGITVLVQLRDQDE